ncbi:MAG: insulinase family protein [Ignavibacteriae bacterium]|nr:insulinase family protein [Ignavibacteriota bacterium]
MKTTITTIMLGLFLTSMISHYVRAGDDIDRTKRPVGKPAPKIQLPKIQKATLKNGLKVWLVEHHELPTVALNLVIQAGSDHDPVNQPGIASMTADVLDEGTTTRDALQISEELESIGASFAVNANFDGSFLTLSTLTKHLDRALDVYADVLTHPTFPQKEFDRLKNQRTGTLIQQRDQPPTIANNAFSYILYGTDHPYGNNPMGTEPSLQTMSREHLVHFYETSYRPNNATLIVVGDVRLGDITSRLEKALADWKTKELPSSSVPDPKLIDRMRVYLIDKPGAPQSEVRIGYPALARSTPDFFPVVTMNRMLGGQFTSRINLNLREKHGYTYGARSVFSFFKGVGPFSASGGIVTEKTDSALHEFLYEINLMRQKGMTTDELTYVKKGLLGNFALTFETPSQIAGNLQNIILYGLPEDYYENYLRNIESITLNDIQRVAQKYLDTSKMAVVVVGDLTKIKEPVSAMKLGEVILCDVNGKPLP